MSALKCIERKPQSMSFGFKSHKNGLKSTILLNQTSTLSKQFFTNLIELETRFQNKSCTAETLNQLVQHYAKAVEYYDQAKDDIASYFAFKIQDILATKKSMTMLLKTNQKLEDKENVRPSQNSSFIESKTVENKSKRKQEMCQVEEEYQSEAIENSNEDKPVVEKELHKTMKNIKNRKKRFVNLFCKVESEIDTTKQNMNATLTTFETSQTSNDNYIQTDLVSQKEKLRKRLERRKFESFSINVLNASNSQYPSFIIPEFSERKDLLHPGFVGVSDVGGDFSEKYRFSLEVSSECELQSANLSVEELEGKILEPIISGSQEIDKQEVEKDASSKIVQLKNGENDSFDDEKNSTETDTNSEV